MVRIATMRDVAHISATMWERGRKELCVLGMRPVLWLAGWSERVKRGDAVAFGDYAILGCDPDGDAVCTAFQASTEFEAPGIGRQVTQAMRDEIPKLMKGRGIKTANVYSICIDTGAPKWFRLLGFEEDLMYRGTWYGPYNLRKFVRREI